MAFSFQSVIDKFVQLQVYQFVLPFILIFVVTYGILIRTKIFGSAVLNAAVSLVIAFFASFYLSSVPETGYFLSFFFGRIGLILILILAILIIYSFVQGAPK